jgi:hypothetical protein
MREKILSGLSLEEAAKLWQEQKKSQDKDEEDKTIKNTEGKTKRPLTAYQKFR